MAPITVFGGVIDSANVALRRDSIRRPLQIPEQLLACHPRRLGGDSRQRPMLIIGMRWHGQGNQQ